jgi:hypothetical protein
MFDAPDVEVRVSTKVWRREIVGVQSSARVSTCHIVVPSQSSGKLCDTTKRLTLHFHPIFHLIDIDVGVFVRQNHE